MHKIILDCDPGHDDAIAIMVANSSEKIDLLGISVVAGNQTLDKTVKNTLNIVQHLDIDTEVYRGLSEPLVREKQRIADDIHGVTGLDGPVFDTLIRQASDLSAIEFYLKTLRESQEKIKIVATGPLTNVAVALVLAEDLKENIEEIVIMGGSYQLGNTTPAAEFNIYADAEAARIVFNSGIPITMMGLDVTRKVLVLPEIMDRVRAINNKASKFFIDLMEFFNKAQKEVFGWEGGPLHDPLTLIYLIDPSVVETITTNVTIDTSSSESYGRTNCDIFQILDRPSNAKVAVQVDVDKYWDIICEEIEKYD